MISSLHQRQCLFCRLGMGKIRLRCGNPQSDAVGRWRGWQGGGCRLSWGGRRVVVYGEPLFAARVAQELGLALLEPSFTWLADLPYVWRGREVRATALSEARLLREEAFIKPADDKVLSREGLRDRAGVAG